MILNTLYKCLEKLISFHCSVHDRPQVTSGLDTKQPRRDNLLRPRWPEEFIVEPVQTARYGIVALETGALGFKAVKVHNLILITKNSVNFHCIAFYFGS